MAVVEGVRAGAAGRVTETEARGATDDELERIHPREHVLQVAALDAAGMAWPDPDTYVCRGSMEAARRAAGATIDAALAVAEGRARVAFAAVRPPGHHASAQRPTGFCLFNNVAVAVGALRATGAARRIAIVDWDVHHGDGTQDIFDTDPDVWYASTHQWPLYPGSGGAAEDGSGPARGTKQNRPLPPGSGDEPFVTTWLHDLLPGIEAFEPEAILVSAGYDAHRDDPLANLIVTEAGFEAVATALGRVVARRGLPGVALALEGGYDLDALRGSVAATVRGLLSGADAAG
jgi:acetoin utilization deacetylase AcuC-like enzyme